jgi:hypothetical protein
MIIKNKNIDMSFFNFINNSKISYYSCGKNSIILKADLNYNIESPYLHLNHYNFKKPVSQLIIKIIFLSTNYDPGDDTFLAEIDNKMIELAINEIDMFINEVNIQTNIYFKTYKDFQPICPGIIYANYFKTKDNVIKIFNLFMKLATHTNTYSNNYKSYKTKLTLNNLLTIFMNNTSFNSIGLIGMEYAENYKIISSFLSNNFDIKIYKNMARFILLKLCLETGYSHGDFHLGNIIINNNINNYIHTILGNILLIDFGYSVKIDVNKLDKIKNYVDKKDYSNALSIIYNIPRVDGLNLTESKYDIYFKWLCDGINNNELNILFDSYEYSKNIILNKSYKFNFKDNIKNYLFNGIL